MNTAVSAKLIELNRQFYQRLGPQFSATRQRLQPGVMRILKDLPAKAQILDLGCGNGEFACNLQERQHSGNYLGIDFSQALLSEARQRTAGFSNINWLQADLASGEWLPQVQQICASLRLPLFDFVFAFAVLHHLPGESLRLQALNKIRQVLKPNGAFIHSQWQFLNSPRLAKRIQPWEKADLSSEDVDPGDYLLDWRHEGYGLRYVHSFTEMELQEMASAANFAIQTSFYSDGEGGNLGLYQIWKPV